MGATLDDSSFNNDFNFQLRDGRHQPNLKPITARSCESLITRVLDP